MVIWIVVEEYVRIWYKYSSRRNWSCWGELLVLWHWLLLLDMRLSLSAVTVSGRSTKLTYFFFSYTLVIKAKNKSIIAPWLWPEWPYASMAWVRSMWFWAASSHRYRLLQIPCRSWQLSAWTPHHNLTTWTSRYPAGTRSRLLLPRSATIWGSLCGDDTLAVVLECFYLDVWSWCQAVC